MTKINEEETVTAEDLGIKMTTKEGELWEKGLERVEEELLQDKVARQINEHLLGFLKDKCKEHSIDLGED